MSHVVNWAMSDLVLLDSLFRHLWSKLGSVSLFHPKVYAKAPTTDMPAAITSQLSDAKEHCGNERSIDLPPISTQMNALTFIPMVMSS